MKRKFYRAVVQNGHATFTDPTPEQIKRLADYEQILQTAFNSDVANPPFSNYFCKESIGRSPGTKVPAGNIEYALCKALHGEVSAIAAFRAVYGRDKRRHGPIILGIHADQSEESAGMINSCGDCRDIMLDDLGPDTEIVAGAPGDENGYISKLSDYLFGNYEELDSELPRNHKTLLGWAKHQESMVYDPYSPADVYPERRYSAMIFTANNEYHGPRVVLCDYHPTYALEAAILQAEWVHDPLVAKVIVFCRIPEGRNLQEQPFVPHVMYRDRQHLMELNLQQELLTGVEKDPPVYLLTYDDSGIVQGWKTSIKQWLPFAFTPRNFGQEAIERLTNYNKKLAKHI